MKISSYANRVGGFASINTGVINDCYTDAVVNFKVNAAGFVFENTGMISNSVAQKKTVGKENIGGFCFRNKGIVLESGWLRKDAKEKKYHKKYSDLDFAVDYEKFEELKEKLGLGVRWKTPAEGDRRLEFSEELHGNALATEVKDIVEISSADELFKIAQEIASGDAYAASCAYKLTKDINLKGKKWLPIGLSETMAFSGVFDGNGFKVYNFKVDAKNLNYAGFFGYVKDARVMNLTLDCVVKAAGGNTTGSMCGTNNGGEFSCCRVLARVNAEKCCGGFVGNNMGTIEKCCFIGKITPVVPLLLWLLPLLGGIFLLLIIGVIILIINLNKSPYNPTIIDPNGKPIVDNSPVTPPPAGSSRISFECNQEVYVDANSQIGIIQYVNPKRSTQDVEICIKVSDAELIRTIGKTGRSAADQAKLEASAGYDPKTTYQVLYRSGRLKIGYMLELCQFEALPDGTKLPAGDYEMIVGVEAFDPETYEKAVVNAQAPISVHIIGSSES